MPAARLATALALAAGLLAGGARAADQAPRTVDVSVTEDGLQPDAITVKKGVPVKLVVTRKTDATCITQLVSKDLGLDLKLPLNQPAVAVVTPAKAGKFKVVCGMGMHAATLTVQ